MCELVKAMGDGRWGLTALDYRVVLGIDLIAEGVHFLLTEFGQIEEVAGFELVVPRLACMSLGKGAEFPFLPQYIQFRGSLFSKKDERTSGQPAGISHLHRRWLASINCSQVSCSSLSAFTAVRAGADRGREAAVARLRGVAQDSVRGFVVVGCLALFREVPQGHVLELTEPLDGVVCGVRQGHGEALGLRDR